MLLLTQIALPPPRIPAANARRMALRPPPLASAPAVPDYASILSAPLFAPDRRPGDAELPHTGGGGELDAYSAVGAGAGGRSSAAILAGPGGILKTLRPGESLEGWRLVGVSPSRLTFEKDGTRRVLVVGAASAAEARSPAKAAPDQANEP